MLAPCLCTLSKANCHLRSTQFLHNSYGMATYVNSQIKDARARIAQLQREKQLLSKSTSFTGRLSGPGNTNSNCNMACSQFSHFSISLVLSCERLPGRFAYSDAAVSHCLASELPEHVQSSNLTQAHFCSGYKSRQSYGAHYGCSGLDCTPSPGDGKLSLNNHSDFQASRQKPAPFLFIGVLSVAANTGECNHQSSVPAPDLAGT